TIGLVTWYVIGAWCWFLLVVYAATYTDGGLNTDFPSAMLCRRASRSRDQDDKLEYGISHRASNPAYMRLPAHPGGGDTLKESTSNSAATLSMLPVDQASADLTHTAIDDDDDLPLTKPKESWTERLAGHAQKVGLVVYLFHWLFADILTGLFVIPFEMPFSTALPFLYIGCILCSWCAYAVIIQVPLLRSLLAV
ncbi:hypothetical protein Pmar_PMAR005074, partial [Perkinsus marinus ATCC 50983]